jgi:acetolactate synthase-1/2/3 large subunit
MKVYEALADAFRAEGVDCVFGLMGDANLKWWSAMADGGARMLSARHETAVVAMADGYAQATGRVGVAAVTCGPALVHAATPLIAAARARVPLVLFAGDTPAAGIGNPQDIDQRRVADLCEAGFVQVRSSSTVAEDVRRAFFRARTERRPVVLDVPMDLQGADVPGAWHYASSLALAAGGQRVQPDPRACAEVVDLIAGSRRPVLIGGRGGIASGAGASTLALATRIGALVATTMPAKGWLDEDEFAVGLVGPLASALARELFAEADLVIAVGSSLDRYATSDGGQVFPQARIVSLTDGPALQGSSCDPDLLVVGDADASLRRILALLDERQLRADGFRTPETRERIAAYVAQETPPAEGGSCLDPRTVMRVLEDFLEDDEDVVVGVGHFLSFAAMHLRRPTGGRFFWTHWFGAIGYALPTGLGLAAARSPRRVTVIEGDGSLMMALPELETAARLGLAVRVVVVNDEALGAEMHKLRAEGLDPTQAHLATPDFGAVSRVLGGSGDLVSDADGLRAALGRRCAGLHVVDARTDRAAMSELYDQLHFGHPHRAPHQRRLQVPAAAP